MNAVAEIPKPVVIPEGEYDRKAFIGSSNVAAIMGLAPDYEDGRETPLSVYLAKTGDEPEEMSPARRKFLDRRKRWEPVVVQFLKEELEVEILGTNIRYRDGAVDYFAAEIDFEWRVDEGSAQVLQLPERLIGSIQNGEIKSVSPRAFSERFGWGEPGSDQIPINYECQCVHGLGVTQREVCIVAAFVGLDSMEFYPIVRNDVMLTSVRDQCQYFWERYVLAKTPPPAQTIPDLAKLYKTPAVPAQRVDAESEIGSKALRLRAIRGSIEALKLEEESLEFDVKLALKDAEELYVDGRKIATWAEQNWSRLDQERLKDTEKKIWREYFKRGKHRVFKTLKGG